MNKKILAVGVTAVVAGAFWACGSGEIYQPSENDMLFKEMGSTKNLLCNEENQNCDGAFSSEAEVSSSSDDDDYVPPEIGDGDIGDIIINPGSSSSGDTLEIGEIGTSTPTKGELGSCAPVETPINKGVAGAAQFKFKPNSQDVSGYGPLDFVTASYDWDYGAGATAAGTETSTSANVTYANSGVVNASVTVKMSDGKSQKIQCSPLQVNGDPITGCKCTNDAVGTVDFKQTPNVKWTVSGCTSTAPTTVNSFKWEGTEGAVNTFTKTFTAATDSYAPKLVVGNSDNTVQTVTCPAVKVSNGPEYMFTITRASGTTRIDKTSLAVPDGGCITIAYSFTSNYQNENPKVLVSCSARRTDCDESVKVNYACPEDISLSLSYGTVTKSSGKSSSNVDLQGFEPGEPLVEGLNKELSKKVCVTLTGNNVDAATCSVRAD